jgi:hypothetical protein
VQDVLTSGVFWTGLIGIVGIIGTFFPELVADEDRTPSRDAINPAGSEARRSGA